MRTFCWSYLLTSLSKRAIRMAKIYGWTPLQVYGTAVTQGCWSGGEQGMLLPSDIALVTKAMGKEFCTPPHQLLEVGTWELLMTCYFLPPINKNISKPMANGVQTD